MWLYVPGITPPSARGLEGWTSESGWLCRSLAACHADMEIYPMCGKISGPEREVATLSTGPAQRLRGGIMSEQHTGAARHDQLLPSSRRKLRAMPRAFVLCACGCGTDIPKWDDYGRPRKYVPGHHPRPRSDGQKKAAIISGKRLGRSNKQPWNKGKYYRLRCRKVYASRCSWTKALKLLYGDRCAVCGWAEASCDSHHLVPKANGGANTMENGVVLCPNHHRMAEEGKLSNAQLIEVRDTCLQPILEAGTE